MSDKQDRVSPRNACEILRRYNFGKTFAETMGLAKSASNKADKAVDSSTKSAQELDEKLDHEEIFNRLTKNGALQGLYRGEDGELYVNASFIMSGIIDAAVVKVVNLIAERLKSISGTTSMEIEGAILRMMAEGKQRIFLGASDFGSSLIVSDYAEDTEKCSSMVLPDMISVAGQMEHYGIADVAALGIDPETGRSYAQFGTLNGKTISWKDNGDGTFTIIGT